MAVVSTGSLSPTITMQAIGGYGSGVNAGGAGTVYYTSSMEKVLQIDNDNRGYTRDTPIDPVRRCHSCTGSCTACRALMLTRTPLE